MEKVRDLLKSIPAAIAWALIAAAASATMLFVPNDSSISRRDDYARRRARNAIVFLSVATFLAAGRINYLMIRGERQNRKEGRRPTPSS